MNIFILDIFYLRVIKYERYIYLFYALFITHSNAFRRPLDEFAYINNRDKRLTITIINRDKRS